jgi:hypothetical protein
MKPPNRKGVQHQDYCLNDEPGVTICICEPDFFEEDEPIEDVLVGWEEGEKGITKEDR